MTLDTGPGIPKKTVFLSIALLAIGMYFLPTTLSVFSGQHTFDGGVGPDSNVSCKSCHEDIYVEVLAETQTDIPHQSLTSCKGCHRTGGVFGGFALALPGFPGAKYTNVTADPNAHATVTVECSFCHTLVLESAGVPQEMRGPNESHQPYYNFSNTSTLLRGRNEACIGCHTHAAISVNWIRPENYGINASLVTGVWNVSFSYNNTTYNNTTTTGQ